jgi:hypothetical protein
MAAPISTALPAAPSRSDSPDVFEEKAFAFVGALEPFRVDLQAQADFVNTNVGPGSDAETVANIAADVTTVAGVAGDITQLVANDWTKSFLTLAAATADPNIVVDDEISIKERTTGNGGGGVWDVVLSSTLTPNGVNVVQSTGVDGLSLVQRYNYTGDMFNSVALLKTYGLPSGITVETTSYYGFSATDTHGGGTYKIMTAGDFGGTPDELGDHTLANGNVAKLVRSTPSNPAQYGLSASALLTDLQRRQSLQACIDALPSFSQIFQSDHAGSVHITQDSNMATTTVYGFDCTASPITMYSNLKISGDESVVIDMTSGTTLFGAHDRFVSASFHIELRGLTLANSSGLSGSIGVDLTRCSYFLVDNLRMRGWEKALVVGGGDGTGSPGGFYNEINSCELAGNTTAIYSDFSFNSSKIKGGRILSNVIGFRLEGSTDVSISTAFEKNNLGALLISSNNNSFNGCRFEGNSRGAGGGGAIDFVTGGAIRFNANTAGNTVHDCWFSGASDHIIDLSQRNAVTGIALSGGGESCLAENFFGNPACDIDSNSDGLADGFEIVPTTGITYSIDRTTYVTGSGAQSIAIDATNVAAQHLYLQFAVIPNQVYTINVNVKTISTASIWNLRVSKTGTGVDFINVALAKTTDSVDAKKGYNTYSVQFLADEATLAGQTFLYLTFFMNSSLIGSVSKLLIDSISISEGVQTTRGGAVTQKMLTVSTNRPTLYPANVGQQAWSADLNKLEVWSGTSWLNADGTAA